MNPLQPHCLWNMSAELAEGPVWIEREQRLYFVDIKQQKIHSCTANGALQKSWDVPQQIGFLLPASNGNFIAGLQSGLHHFSPNDGTFQPYKSVEQNFTENRLNDGYTDSNGRLWFGTMDNNEIAASGSLYRIDEDSELKLMDSNYIITNGPTMSPDGKTFYHTDTLNQSIYAFDVSAQGALSDKRLLIRIKNGYPDGTAIDAAGYLWIALFGGHRIERYTPEGILAQTIRFPCANITKLAFGGTDLRTAFVTTASKGLSHQERLKQPYAGALFTFQVKTPGLPQYEVKEGFLI